MQKQNQCDWLMKGQELLDNIRTYQSEDVVCLWRLGQCGYAIRYRNLTILIDPMLNDLVEDGKSRRLYDSPFSSTQMAQNMSVDFIICTHGHADHLAPETLMGFMKSSNPPTFIVPAGCKCIMEAMLEECKSNGRVEYLSDEKMLSLDSDVSIRAFSAAHPMHYLDDNDQRMALCYELTLGDKNILHLGDTYLTERLYNQLKSIKAPDLLLPPINGDDLFRKMRNCIGNMEAEEAAKLAYKLNAKLAIPTHYDMVQDNTVNPQRFMDELAKLGISDRGKLLQLGECLELTKIDTI